MANETNESKTKQEQLWAGPFGDRYIERNRDRSLLARKTALFSKILSATDADLSSALELGPNIGLNLLALRTLFPSIDLTAIEINEQAVDSLRDNIDDITVHHASIYEFESNSTWDLVFTKGVLIHVPPSHLGDVYELMYQSTSKYIVIVEYYNPTPTEVSYRGLKGQLFKRDFAGEMLDRFPKLRLVDYGFQYHRDPVFPEDDFTWFVLSKE